MSTHTLSNGRPWEWNGTASPLQKLAVGDRVWLATHSTDSVLLEALHRDKSATVIEALFDRYGDDVPDDLIEQVVGQPSVRAVERLLRHYDDSGRDMPVLWQMHLVPRTPVSLVRWSRTDPSVLRHIAQKGHPRIAVKAMSRTDVPLSLFVDAIGRVGEEEPWTFDGHLHPVLEGALDLSLAEHPDEVRDAFCEALASASLRLLDYLSSGTDLLDSWTLERVAPEVLLASCQSPEVARTHVAWRALTDGPDRLSCRGCLHAAAGGSRHDGVSAGAKVAFGVAAREPDAVSALAAEEADARGDERLRVEVDGLTIDVSPTDGLTIHQTVAKVAETTYTWISQEIGCTCQDDEPLPGSVAMRGYRKWEEPAADGSGGVVRFVNWALPVPGLFTGAPCGPLVLSQTKVALSETTLALVHSWDE